MQRWCRYRWFQVGFVWMKSDDTRLDRPGFDWGWGYEYGQQVRVRGWKASSRCHYFTYCTEKCRNYRNLKQRKKRQFKQSCIDKIEEICVSNRGCMWETISAFAPKTLPVNLPGGVEFLDHYKQLAQPVKSSDFDYQHERNIKESLRFHDTHDQDGHHHSDPKTDILNKNFSPEEITEAVRSLKNKKSVGTDCIPAEFIKFCNDNFIQDICDVLNYCIESRQFPETWTEGLRSSIYKAGDKLNPDNYRGVTVLPIFEKIFEIVVQRRLEFINDAFARTDKYNGGFLKGSRTIHSAKSNRAASQPWSVFNSVLYRFH